MNSDDIYTPIGDVAKILKERSGDVELKKKVDFFLRGNIPENLIDEPKAVLARPIISPDIEHFLFLELAKRIGLKTSSWEYLSDKFYTINDDKMALAKMKFAIGSKDKFDLVSKKIISFKNIEGKCFKDIKTLWGENLVDFHHRILKQSKSDIELFDGSEWYLSFGQKALDYYKYYLAVFICRGVLFENFICDNSEHESENGFSKNVFLPAVRDLVSMFGVKPLIVKLLPEENSSNDYYWCYPESGIIEEIDNLIKQNEHNN